LNPGAAAARDLVAAGVLDWMMVVEEAVMDLASMVDEE